MSPKNIMVKCPQCERVYIDWHTPAITEKDAPTTSCSQCGHRVCLRDLSDVKGVWQQIAEV